MTEPRAIEQQMREAFVRRLTEDSETDDRRRRDYNQAIFNAEYGWAIFSDTDLDMVMDAFDRAMSDVFRGHR